MAAYYQTLGYVFLVSAIFVGSIIYGFSASKLYSNDLSFGPQKIHQGSVSRLGGVGIFLSLASYCIFADNFGYLMSIILMTATPILIVGVVEDLTAKIIARNRLLISLLSGLLFSLVSNYSITKLGFDFLDSIVETQVLSIILTSIAIAGLVNAINIIDGLNGLAAGTAIIMSLCFALIAFNVGDVEIFVISLVVVAATSGFLIWNFPGGKIFLGDGGAYLLGALLACLAITLSERNEAISPFFSLLVVLYPIYETLRSAVRRIFTKGISAFEPDAKHLHSLVFKLFVQKISMRSVFQNSLAAVCIMFLPLGTSFWAIMNYSSHYLLIIGSLLFVVVYELTCKIFVRLIDHNLN